MTERILDYQIEMAVALGRRAEAHALLDDYLGRMPDGRPVVRLGTPLERTDAPSIVAAWACSTGARAEVYGPVASQIVRDLHPGPLAVESLSPLHHVRWPSAAAQDDLADAVGYVITRSRDAETGEWTQLADRDETLANFGLRRLTGTPEEMDAAIEAAEVVEAAAALDLGEET